MSTAVNAPVETTQAANVQTSERKRLSSKAEVNLPLIDKKKLKKADVEVFVTLDYDMFHFSNLNREPKLSRKLKDSVKLNDLTKFNPILVDEKGLIIDGQHRYVVCKELGYPIYFIVGSNLEIVDASAINQATNNWSTLNYIEHYYKRGFPAYVKLFKLSKEHKQFVTNLLALGKGSVNKNETITDLTKLGKFEFREKINPKELLENYEIFRQYIDFSDNTIFFKAYIRVASLADYDHKRMVKKLKETGGAYLLRMPTQALQIDNILKTYNYRSPNKLKLDKQGDKSNEVITPKKVAKKEIAKETVK